MNIKKGDRFKDYVGTPCFISYIKGDIIKLSFIEDRPHVEVWIGKTTEEARKLEDWYHQWTMTTTQFELFKAYAIPLLRKVFKFNKKRAENTFSWFNLQFGLRISD